MKEQKDFFFGRQGFTLVEILVAVAILVVVAGIATSMFFSLLRGYRKAKILTEVKQNGNFALMVMERMIRNARAVTGDCRADMTSLTIKNPDGGETTFSFEVDKISSNSASLTSDKVRPVIYANFFNCEQGESGARPDKVSIHFRLEEAQPAVRPEDKAWAFFQTTVTLRNY